MRRALLLTWILLLGAAHAQTLGQAVQKIHDDCTQILERGRQTPTLSWGEQTALDDLAALQNSAQALLDELDGDDARLLTAVQRDLSSSSSRARASYTLLPETARDTARLEEILQLSQAVDARISELRLRFAQKASRVSPDLASQALTAEQRPLSIYENPKKLLIDVRDARQLASSLQTGRFPPLGFGLAQPNNLDSVQVQRFMQAGWALQRGLEGDFEDISEITPLWEKFQFEYNRLGYAGSNNVTHQLERVMARLGEFFAATAQP